MHRLSSVGLTLGLALFLGEHAAGDETNASRQEPWTLSRIVGSPDPPAPYRVERVFPSLQFKNPVEVARAPGSERLFVAELAGKLYSFVPDVEAAQADLFFDLPDAVQEARQVYGLTFHPDFAENRYCYLCYVLAPGLPEGTRVSRFRVRDTDPPQIDPSSETIIITWLSGGHNGGCLQFGPDGYLYISTGDGAGPNPPDALATGQDNRDLLSAILRIDVDQTQGGRRYRVPSDNPFLQQPETRPEIWAYGFRNPWKMSFAPDTGDLWVGDVGWELWEMVYRVERGGNYGWSVTEGPQPVRTNLPRGPTPILPPAAAHLHTEARSITGGYVYRGPTEDLRGAYIYGDYVTGKIWGLRWDGEKVAWRRELADTTLEIIAFAEDHEGELYVVDYGGGCYRLTPNEAENANQPFPQTLRETGLFASTAKQTPAPGVVAYSICAEPWMDYASAERWIALPGASLIDASQNAWRFPENAVLAKTISLEMTHGDPATRRRLETQVLHFDGVEWRGYTYLWNDAQTDAVLAPAEGATRVLSVADPSAPGGRREQTWRFHSRTECAICHNPRAGGVLGFTAAQLASPETDLPVGPLPTSHSKIRRLIDPYDESAELDRRARSYLHANCAHCHRTGGGGTAPFELRFELPLEKTRMIDQQPSQGTCGLYAARVLAPADPYRSVLIFRMSTLGRGRMPHLGSEIIDERGLRLVHDWVAELPTSEDAAELAGVQSLRSRQREALAALRGVDAAQKTAALDELLGTISGALLVVHAIDGGVLASKTRSEVVARAASHQNAQVRELFERFLPPDQRVRRLGAVVDPAQILSLNASAERGRELFFRAEGLACRSCHRVGQEGKAVGPELSSIGKKYDRPRLLEAIFDPSKAVDPQWVAYTAETRDGRVYTGLLARKTEKEIVIKDALGNEIALPADTVEFLAPQPKSLMPDLLLQEMTAQDAADLVEFLSGLK